MCNRTPWADEDIDALDGERERIEETRAHVALIDNVDYAARYARVMARPRGVRVVVTGTRVNFHLGSQRTYVDVTAEMTKQELLKALTSALHRLRKANTVF